MTVAKGYFVETVCKFKKVYRYCNSHFFTGLKLVFFARMKNLRGGRSIGAQSVSNAGIVVAEVNII